MCKEKTEDGPKGVAFRVPETAYAEAQHLAEGFKSYVANLHSSQTPPTDENIKQCLLLDMQRCTRRVRDLLVQQPRQRLLYHLIARNIYSAISGNDLSALGHVPTQRPALNFTLSLNYLHAVWSSTPPPRPPTRRSLDHHEVEAALLELHKLHDLTAYYAQLVAASKAPPLDTRHPSFPHIVFAEWVNRSPLSYPPIDESVLRFLLDPHDFELQTVYNLTSREISAGVRRVADSDRQSFNEYATRSRQLSKVPQPGDFGHDRSTYMLALQATLEEFGACNLTRHSGFSQPLLTDLSYQLGEEADFWKPGPLQGTPLLRMPYRIRPGIWVDGECFVTDSSHLVTEIYRCVRRGLISRNASYKEEWNNKQSLLLETAFLRFLRSRARGPRHYHSVYYPSPWGGKRVEADLVIVIEDVLLLVEAKGGIMSMTSPALDFESHIDGLDRLTSMAGHQCLRFVEYLRSESDAPIFQLRRGRLKEVERLCLKEFRAVIPIGLTLDALGPLAANSVINGETRDRLGEHAFLSVSLKELFVLRRFLRCTGEFIHYLLVRQEVARARNFFVVDEMEFLGAYIQDNVFFSKIREQCSTHSYVLWDTSADFIYGSLIRGIAGRGQLPRSTFPPRLRHVLSFLDKHRPKGWLGVDNTIRSLSADGRLDLGRNIEAFFRTNTEFRCHSLRAIGGDPLCVWMCHVRCGPSKSEVEREARRVCRKWNAHAARVLQLHFNTAGMLRRASCKRCVPRAGAVGPVAIP